MRSLRLSVAVAVVAVVAVACGGGGKPSAATQPALSARWSAPSILAQVPAGSPYVFALLESASDALRRQISEGFQDHFNEMMQRLDKLHLDRSKMPPWARAFLAFSDELHGDFTPASLERLGFDPRGRFVVYGLSLWPVARLEISSAPKVRGLIERAMAAAGMTLEPRTFDGRAYWLIADSEASIVIAVLDHELVASVMPTVVLDAALPQVLGARAPEHSLAATAVVPELLARHHFLNNVLGYIDSHNLVEIIAGSQPGALDIPLRAATGPVSDVCRAELDRLAGVMPRLAIGYRRLDAGGFDGSMVFELPASVAGGLRKLHAAVPEVTSHVQGHPLFVLGAAADPGAVVAWLRDATRQIHDRPFACPWFHALNEANDELAAKLATPLPPTWQGLRGFSMTIDDASITPPNIAGHLVVAGERVADLIKSLAGTIPAIAGIPLARDGKPIALPTQLLRLPTPSAHFALTTDRLVIAAGTGSEQRVIQHLASPAPRSSPLMVMAFDMPRVQKLLEALHQPMQNIASLGELGVVVDVGDAGLGFDFWGTWPARRAPPPAQIAAPPPPAPPAQP